jgi:GxxExxY protein
MALTPDHLRLAHGDITHRIIGAFWDVCSELRGGYLESVYANAFPIALRDRGLSVESERAFPVFYKHTRVGEFRADFVVEDKVIVELKAVAQLTEVHDALLINYLRASQKPVGLLFNFGPKPAFRRLMWTGDAPLKSS